MLKSRRREKKKSSAPNQMLVIHTPLREGKDVKTIPMLSWKVAFSHRRKTPYALFKADVSFHVLVATFGS
jgi:hypothetical protein